MSSLVYNSSVLTQLAAMGLMPKLLDEVVQSVRKLKRIIIIMFNLGTKSLGVLILLYGR